VAREIWKSLGKATRDLAKTIKALKLDADLSGCDSVYFTLDPDKVKALRKEFDARKAAGLPGRWLTAAALYRMTGMRAQAAIATSGNAQVNPVRACQGFLAAAARRGASVFERSRVRGVHRVAVADRSADSRRHDLSRAHRRGDWLCHAGISGAGRALQDEGHLRSRHKAVRPAKSAGDGLGHRSSVSLRAMERRRAFAGRR
jgi:glycine/D-amino acid oxidase-like deaminating enzyme